MSRGKTIRTSIEYVIVFSSGYWRNLWSSVNFMDKSLKSCTNAIHTGVVEIWNLNDTNKYLQSDRFKISMSHVVKDLAVPVSDASRG
ncbi:hypothetical protein BGY98DRAFT_983585 [Russula aff. rugulosa BPL654]|nr:hypothetical protein BGY98DRAFT_983585 [Russula aff. rugulosa BPL654]